MLFKLFQKPIAGDLKTEIETLKSEPDVEPVSKSGPDFETMTKLRSDIEAETKRLGKFRSKRVALEFYSHFMIIIVEHKNVYLNNEEWVGSLHTCVVVLG